MYEIAEVEEVTGSVLVLLEVGVEGEGEGVVVVEVTWRIEQAIRGARAADAIYGEGRQRRMGRLDQFVCIVFFSFWCRREVGEQGKLPAYTSMRVQFAFIVYSYFFIQILDPRSKSVFRLSLRGWPWVWR